MLKITVPYLTHSRLDLAVDGLLAEFAAWTGRPVRPPIDIDEIAEQFLGLTLEILDLQAELGIPDVLGATWFDERRIAIDHSLEDLEGRYAFTMAHEIAHWRLHRPSYEEQKRAKEAVLPLFPVEVSATDGPAIVCRSGQAKERAEWQADQYAARLIMPSEYVRSAAHQLHDGPLAIKGLDRGRKERELPRLLRDYANQVIDQGRFTNVSREAMCYRLCDLGLALDETRMSGNLFHHAQEEPTTG